MRVHQLGAASPRPSAMPPPLGPRSTAARNPPTVAGTDRERSSQDRHAAPEDYGSSPPSARRAAPLRRPRTADARRPRESDRERCPRSWFRETTARMMSVSSCTPRGRREAMPDDPSSASSVTWCRRNPSRRRVAHVAQRAPTRSAANPPIAIRGRPPVPQSQHLTKGVHSCRTTNPRSFQRPECATRR